VKMEGMMQTIDLTIPLIGGDAAYLRIQRPLSSENFDYFVQQLGMMRRGLTGCLSVPPGDETHCQAIRDEGVSLEQRHALVRLGHAPEEIAGMSYARACELIGK
jgi:hypothetical protein